MEYSSPSGSARKKKAPASFSSLRKRIIVPSIMLSTNYAEVHNLRLTKPSA